MVAQHQCQQLLLQQNEFIRKGIFNIGQAMTETAAQMGNINNNAPNTVHYQHEFTRPSNCKTNCTPTNQIYQQASLPNASLPLQQNKDSPKEFIPPRVFYDSIKAMCDNWTGNRDELFHQ